ncbi:MAG: DUF429 domain-containing protein [Trueperaceae bacterium]
MPYATVLGVDCATRPEKVGLARAVRDEFGWRLTDAVVCGRHDRPAERLAAWLEGPRPTLLALDAPLGWPLALGRALTAHRAGAPLDPAAHDLFDRHTDHVVARDLGKRPLSVGADRIARTAHAALSMLEELRTLTGATIPLAWQPEPTDDVVAIEVYPAATLIAHGVDAKGYKAREAEDARSRVRDLLENALTMPLHLDLLSAHDDVVDAALCVLAGVDFAAGAAAPPQDWRLAEIEGWIWVRRTC